MAEIKIEEIALVLAGSKVGQYKSTTYASI